MLSESDRAIIERFKSLMAEHGVPVVETVAFGSRARGDAEPDSDLDVLVIVDYCNWGMEMTLSDCAWEAGFDSGVLVQAVIMTRDEVEKSPQRSSLFIMAVRRDGVKV